MFFSSKYVYAPKEQKEEYEYVPEGIFNHTAAATDDDPSADDGETCILDILDTAGQEEYTSTRDRYVRNGNCFVIVYSITSRQSFEEASAMYGWIERVKGEAMPVVFCGNKLDLEYDREVLTDEGSHLAKNCNCPFFETSAKLNLNINEAIEALIRRTPRRGKNYKLVIMGSGGVGKSSICVRYCMGTFADGYDPTVEDTYRKLVVVKDIQPEFQRKTDASCVQVVKCSTKPDSKSAPKGKKRSLFGKSSRPEQSAPENAKAATAAAPPMAPPPPRPAKEEKKIKVKAANTNALVLHLGELGNELVLATGDPNFCGQCGAALSHISQLVSSGDTSTWKCEFCGWDNAGLDVTPEAIPSGAAWVDYLLAPPDVKEDKSAEASEKGATKVGHGSSLVIFAIDVSGSMAATTEVPALQAQWSAVTGRGGNGGGTRYISRLEAIREAVKRHLDLLSITEPNTKVALISFDNKITYYGDGSSAPVQLDSSQLDDYHVLMKQGTAFGSDLSLRTLTFSLNDLKGKVGQLETGGSTALGPTLAVGVGMASNFPTAEIILCTDGVSNVGVGNLEGNRDTTGFYTSIGEHAQVSHTVISVLGIEGANSAMEALSSCASITNGTVNILHPLEMVRQIRQIAQNPVVATEVEIMYIMSSAIVAPGKTSESPHVTLIREHLGNATKETDVSFTFSVDGSKVKDSNPLPFQVQIRYKKKDGSKCLRVLSQAKQATMDKAKVETESNVAVMGLAAVQQASKLAQEGKVEEARENLLAAERMLKRSAVSAQQQEEQAIFSEAALELDRGLLQEQSSASASSRGMSDTTANMVHRNKKANLGQFLGGSAKSEVVSKRKADQAVSEQYYGYQFK